MIKFTATIQKFASQGEKTGWTYIVIPAELAQQLSPGNKKSFRGCRVNKDRLVWGISLKLKIKRLPFSENVE